MRRFFSAVIAGLLIASPAIAANLDLGVKTQASPLAAAPYISGDFIPLVRGTAWDHVLATILNPCSATLAGTVPTPPNDASKFLNGQCGWTTPASSGGITVNSTSITGGTTGRLLYDNAGSVGEAVIGAGLSLVGGTLTAPGGGGWGIVGTSVITSGTSGRLLYDNAGVLGELALGTGVATWLGTPSAANFASAMIGAVTVPAGGTGVTGVTANALIKGNGTSPFSAAALTDDGTKVSTSEPFDLTSKTIEVEIPNAGVTGTTVNKLAKLTGAPSTAVLMATTDLDGAVGVVSGGAGTTSSARIAVEGQINCVFDGNTTAGNYVGISPTVAGDCRDLGSTRPLGQQVVGRVLTTNGSGGTYAVQLATNFAPSAGAGTVTNPSNLTVHAPLIGGANGTTDAKAIATLTNGQLVIGSTGADPVPALPTAATPNIVITTGAGTLTVGTTAPQNDISGSGTAIVTGDNAKLDLLGAFTYTLAQAGSAGFGSGWSACLLNTGAGNATVNATTSTFLGAGGSTSLVIPARGWACPTSDGTNYVTPSGGMIVAGTNITLTPNANGTTTFAASGGAGITCPAGFTATNGVCAWTQTVSTVSTVDFTGLTLNDYELWVDGCVQSAAVPLELRFGAANTLYKNAYVFEQSGSATVGNSGTTPLTDGISFASGNTTGWYDSKMNIHNLRSGAANKTAHGTSAYWDLTDFYSISPSGVYTGATTDVSALHIVPASGTVTGTFTLIAKSR